MTTEKNTGSKGRRITGWILTALLALLFIVGASMALIGGEQANGMLGKYGLTGKLALIGTGELISAILFVIPKTSSLGVLLLSAYMGGAIATHMEHGEIYVIPSVVLVII